jgi:hypothetical protein
MIVRAIHFIHWIRRFPLSMATIVYGVGVGVWFLVTPAGALNNRQSILTGGFYVGLTKSGPSITRQPLVYTAPGLLYAYGPDEPALGRGEQAAQLRMTGGGVLSSLWVKVITQSVPTSGSLVATVRINGADTALTCQVFGTGQCQSGAATVAVPNGARMAVAVAHDFVNEDRIALTYSMLLD